MPVSSGLDSALRLLESLRPTDGYQTFHFLLVILSCHNSLKTDRAALTILFVDFVEFTVTALKNRE